jgi:hypothetical protein
VNRNVSATVVALGMSKRFGAGTMRIGVGARTIVATDVANGKRNGILTESEKGAGGERVCQD